VRNSFKLVVNTTKTSYKSVGFKIMKWWWNLPHALYNVILMLIAKQS